MPVILFAYEIFIEGESIRGGLPLVKCQGRDYVDYQ